MQRTEKECGIPGITPVIQDEDDFKRYPWDEIPEYYFEKYSRYFRALREEMPEGMKAIGGVGNGIFECVQDLTGFQGLCYIAADDEELYHDGDIYCVLRFGDDLGYKSSTMLSADDVKKLILPQYKLIVDLVHSYGKPFLRHSLFGWKSTGTGSEILAGQTWIWYAIAPNRN